MRIIGYIEHPTLKITVFKMNTRLSVKFETGLYEQTYKYRMSDDLANLADIRQLMTTDFMAKVEAHFATMHTLSTTALDAFLPATDDDEFEDIM